MGAAESAAAELQAADAHLGFSMNALLTLQHDLGIAISKISSAGGSYAQKYGAILQELSENVVRDGALCDQLRSELRVDVGVLLHPES